MRRLLQALPVLVTVVAAVESVAVRVELSHRPTEVRLFLEAWLLWSALALLALLPAWLTLRLLEAKRPAAGDSEPSSGRLRPALVLGAWMIVPVLFHTILDRHTGICGNLDALFSWVPWIEAIGSLLGLALIFGLISRLSRRVTSGLLVLLLLAGSLLGGSLLGGGLLPWRGSDSALANGAGRQPNLLLLIWDTTRSDRLQPYGYERETTPHLARLADESILFEDSRSVSCFTFSSHLSMLTGVLPSTHGARLVSMEYDPRRATTIAETLRRAGYRTGAFVGTDVLAGRTGIRRGFETYDDQVDPRVCDTRAWKLVHDVQAVIVRLLPGLSHNGRPHWFQDFQRSADEILENAATWIERSDPRPWFCMVNLYDTHWPYLPGTTACARMVRPYAGPLDGYLFRSDTWEEDYVMQEEDTRHVSDLYDGEILELDARVGAFLDRLGLDRGDTAVVLTSDHGEAFGEGGRWKHEDITEPQVRVPLLIRLPESAPRSRRVIERTSGIDIAPTLLGLAGIEKPADAQGYDLLGEELPADRPIMVEDRDRLDPADVRFAYYQGPWKLVRTGLGDETVFELFDLRDDPVGEHDVSAQHPEVREAMAAEMARLRGKAEEEDIETEEEFGPISDALRALGYAGD
jgi:arylsulfatase A-like enzyme